MGAWGSGSFENDDASDWLGDFCETPNKQSITDTLTTVVDMDDADYVEAPDCSVAIAAAEIVAAQKGAANPNLTAEAKECVMNLGPADASIVSLALKALERIRSNSELKELWDESEAPAEWYSSVSNLEDRLRQ